MDKKIRKFTYSFQHDSWYRMFGGMIWSENGKNLLTYLHSYYNPNPCEPMLAMEEEKNIIEDIVDKIIQEDSKDNETCYLCEDDKTDTETNQLDF